MGGRGRKSQSKKRASKTLPPPPQPPACSGTMTSTDLPPSPPKSMAELLPDGIVTDILSRLPAQSVAFCRCVCKPFLNLTINPNFARLHFSKSESHKDHHQILIRAFPFGTPKPFQTLHLLHPQSLANNNEHPESIKPKFVIPKTRKQREETVGEESGFHYYSVVNSCNGFLCLSNLYGDPRVVFTPITSEYVVLPKQKPQIDVSIDDGSGSGPVETTLFKCRFESGFGQCSESNRFKVLRTMAWIGMAEIHVLGTDSWRMLGSVVPSALRDRDCEPMFLDGFLHWGCDVSGIVCFDFRTEMFGEVLLPTSFEEKHKKLMRVGVFGGCLSVCDFRPRRVDLWIMNEYGKPESWTKQFVIETWALCSSRTPRFQPIECLSSGELLILDPKNYGLLCYDFSDRSFRIHKFGDNVREVRAYLHTPSFVSLKDVVAAEHVRVLDVFSRANQIAGEEALVLKEGRRMCIEDSWLWQAEGVHGLSEDLYDEYYEMV